MQTLCEHTHFEAMFQSQSSMKYFSLLVSRSMKSGISLAFHTASTPTPIEGPKSSRKFQWLLGDSVLFAAPHRRCRRFSVGLPNGAARADSFPRLRLPPRISRRHICVSAFSSLSSPVLSTQPCWTSNSSSTLHVNSANMSAQDMFWAAPPITR